MTTKKANGQSSPKMEVKTGKTTTTPVNEKKAEKPTYEELQKRVKELESERLKKPANIQEVINFFEEKKKKINHLELFKVIREKLKDAFALVKPLADDQEFEKREYKLLLSTYSQYGSEEKIFNITNPLVIEKAIHFISGEIDTKMKSLETEIQKDF